MTAAATPQRTGLVTRLSGGMLLAMALVLAGVLAAALSAIILTKSQTAEIERLRATESRLLSTLEEGGLSGLSQKLDALDTGLLDRTEPVLIAVWRLRNGRLTPHRFSPAEAEGILAAVAPGHDTDVRINGQSYRVLSPDIARLSQDWSTPMSDVVLTIAAPDPGSDMRAARQTVIAVWSGLAVALAVGVLLHLNHTRRYRDGLLEINARLERAAAGETGLRMPDDVPAPELRELTDRLNRVLPRFDDLVLGLRDLSATMAHEMKTPLQVIRSDLSRLVRAEDTGTRSARAAAIDRTIDLANARLHSIMQLFRLEAQVDIPMQPAVDLSRIVENAADDLGEILEARGRTVTWSIAPKVRVAGNPQLLDLLVSNLLTNAGKYAPDGARIEIDLSQEGGRFRLSVANSGGGFPEDVRKSAFERFARGRSNEDIPGTGIGLSLVNAIVKRHGFVASITPSDSRAEVVITGTGAGTEPA
ncbi:MAG: HAMP domain-containing sensor histidine kinase [Paracoccaceae bacterium]